MAQNNPYLLGRQEANNRYLTLAASVRNWQITAGCFALLSVGLVASNVLLINKRTVDVIVAQVDQQGQLLSTSLSGQYSLPFSEDILIKAELARWMKQARGISAEWAHQKDEYQALYTKISGAAQQQMTAYFEAHPPKDIAQSFTVNVQPTSIMRVGEKSWQVRWVEAKLAKATGQKVEEAKWEAILTVELQKPTTQQQALENPLGLTITNVSWSQSLE
jgi:type IV secretion system protein VirB5